MSWCRVFHLGDRGSPVTWTTRTAVSDRPLSGSRFIILLNPAHTTLCLLIPVSDTIEDGLAVKFNISMSSSASCHHKPIRKSNEEKLVYHLAFLVEPADETAGCSLCQMMRNEEVRLYRHVYSEELWQLCHMPLAPSTYRDGNASYDAVPEERRRRQSLKKKTCKEDGDNEARESRRVSS